MVISLQPLPSRWLELARSLKRLRGESSFRSDAVARVVLADRPRLVCIAAYGHQPSASTQQMVGAGKIAEEIKGRKQFQIGCCCSGGACSPPPPSLHCSLWSSAFSLYPADGWSWQDR